jgi:hypothetical protein
MNVVKHRKIMALIATIRESHSMMPRIFQFGSCFNFYLILRQVYPEAEAYYNIEHVITKIDDKFYDITGEVPSDGFAPLASYYPKGGVARAMKQMMRAEFPLMIRNRKKCA